MASGELRFSPSTGPDGVIVRLAREQRGLFRRVATTVSTVEWPDFDGIAALSGVAHLRILIEAEDGRVKALPDGAGYLISHPAVAAFTEIQAHGLGLPPAIPFDLRISTRSHIGASDYAIYAAWMDTGGRSLLSRRTGAILEIAGVAYRLPERMFVILEAIDAVNAAVSGVQEDRLAALAALRTLLPETSGKGIEMERPLEEMRLSHATAFSLRIEARLDDAVVSPVLLGRHISERASVDGQVVEDTDSLLPPILDEAFQAEFAKSDVARATYLLERGTYVFIDPALRPALAVVRRVQRGSSAERRAFARNPQAVLKESLLSKEFVATDDVGQAELEAAIDRLFVETRQFSERVTGFGIWAPPPLPHMERVANEWRPEAFAFHVQGKTIQIVPTQLDSEIEKLRGAIASGAEQVSIGGVNIVPYEPLLRTLIGQNPAKPKDRTKDAPEHVEPMPDGPYTLLTRENFLALDYVARLAPRTAALPSSVPGLKPSTRLLPHQYECLSWLRDTYAVGWPGVLLADDMGLGKTLQSLAFLSQLRQAGIARRRAPILIVAPVGLLANWRKEHETHLSLPGLGEKLICAWGTHLQPYRRQAGSDVDVGQPVLDTDALAEADWILTTYETLRDYQASFGPIRFAVAVFDEIQKAKNPASRLTAAVRSVNAGFKIGMTGTPVENGLADLWTIMDCLTPGFLGDLRAFLHDHPTDDAAAQQRLAARLLEPTDGRPPPVLRRLKANILTGLPKKTPDPRPSTMPSVQAERYAGWANDLQAGRIQMLAALHGFRSSSLHPWHPEQAHEGGQEEYIGASARLKSMFEILDVISKKREKALVFVESLDLQPVLAELVRRRYGLGRLPLIINGQVAGAARQKAVDEFQSETGAFDAMILSPRAGGVGLTLTTANHVIHLSRWWNPAVEDQCTDRVYRIGQKREVTVYLPLAEHPAYGDRSYDLVLDKLLEEKRTISRGVFVSTEIGGAELRRRMDASTNEGGDSFDPTELDRMEPLAFEAWFGRQARKAYLEVQLTPRTGDGGADLIFRHPAWNRSAIVQCKHRADPNAPMDERALDDLDRAVRAYEEPDALRIAATNASRFTQTAIRRAERDGIMLLTRDTLHTGLRNITEMLGRPAH